uniref:DUF6538 domain-containing protein n=2 Tax=Enterobacter kobei TaxID=208224 RepID=UPI0032ED89BC
MSQRYKLYRRTSGIYVVRISVPQRFRRYAGQCEIHTSTGTHDLHEAKQKSALLLAVWYQTLQEYEQLDYRTLSDCAPLLAGEGMISLSNFAQSIELPISQLIREVINRNLPVFWLATGQFGFYVDEFNAVEREPGAKREKQSDDEKDQPKEVIILNSAFELGIESFANGYLRPFNPRHTLDCLLNAEVSEGEAAFRTSGDNQSGGWFFDLPGVDITADSLLIREGANKQVISSQADSLIKISRIWAD